jgi:hypothetical protein
VSASLELEDERRSVRDAFITLSRRDREALYRRDVEGTDYGMLAKSIGVSEQGARKIVSRARLGLRHAFEAATGPVTSLVWWLRTRQRTDHLQPVAAGTMHAFVLVALSVAGMAGAGSSGIHDAQVPTDTARRGEQRAEVPTTFGSSVSVRRADSQEPPTGLWADRRGNAGIGVGIPIGSEDEEYVWARVWREQTGEQSQTLSTFDEAGDTGCDAASGVCEQADETLADALDAP